MGDRGKNIELGFAFDIAPNDGNDKETGGDPNHSIGPEISEVKGARYQAGGVGLVRIEGIHHREGEVVRGSWKQ